MVLEDEMKPLLKDYGLDDTGDLEQNKLLFRHFIGVTNDDIGR